MTVSFICSATGRRGGGGWRLEFNTALLLCYWYAFATHEYSIVKKQWLSSNVVTWIFSVTIWLPVSHLPDALPIAANQTLCLVLLILLYPFCLWMSLGLDEIDAERTSISTEIQGDIRFSVWVSFAEIYNDQIFDLLEPISKSSLTKRKTMQLREDKHGNPFIKGLFELIRQKEPNI